MRHATILVAILAFVPLASATAQEPPPVKVGDRVRVTALDLGIRKQAGRFAALRAAYGEKSNMRRVFLCLVVPRSCLRYRS